MLSGIWQVESHLLRTKYSCSERRRLAGYCKAGIGWSQNYPALILLPGSFTIVPRDINDMKENRPWS